MRLFLSCLAFFLISSVALADTIRRTVPANRASSVGAQATYSQSTCNGSVIPKFEVTKAPEHGKVSFKQATFKLSEKAGKCAGKRVKGTAVIFRPDKGFRGKDTFKVGFKMEKYIGNGRIRYVVDRYVITVK